MLRSVVDFRDRSTDKTEAFSYDKDALIAGKMESNFGRLSGFNSMFELYSVLRLAPDTAVDADLLATCNAKGSPMSSGQLAHGPEILKKLELYVSDAGHTMPRRGIALEDGAGLGFFIDGLCQHFNDVIVLDFSLSYLMLASKILEERHISNATLICASAERLPLVSDSIDFIHSNNVIEHVSNQPALISEARRVLKEGAMMFMVSPNRFSLYFEPHFRLPGYGFFPKWLRRYIIQKRQKRSIDTIALPSLGELRTMLAREFPAAFISFVPRKMSRTVTGGRIRGAIVKLLAAPGIGAASNFAINKLMLPIMPYHVAICTKPIVGGGP